MAFRTIRSHRYRRLQPGRCRRGAERSYSDADIFGRIGQHRNGADRRVNLANAPSSGPAASCIGSIAFFNAAGTTIGTATTFTLGTGQVASAPPSIRKRRGVRCPRFDPRRGDRHPSC